jgi:predicted dehydrogenase
MEDEMEITGEESKDSGHEPIQSEQAIGPVSADKFGIIGLIGVGKHGKRHAKQLLELGVQVDAADPMMDVDALNAQFENNPLLKAGKVGSGEFLDQTSAEAVVIATPGKTHFEVVKQALLAGKHVLVEKPFTRTADEARELVALAEAQNRILMVGHNRFYLPHFKRMKDLIDSGKLGKIISVEGNYLNPPQQFDRTHTALEGLGYHQLYMIHGLIGQDHPTEINKVVRSEDSETFGLELNYGDIPVTIRLSRNHDSNKTRNVIVRGEKFTAIFDYTKEPAITELKIEPTTDLSNQAEGTNIDSDSILRQLGVRTDLDGEEAKPSLHHQFLAFREALLTQTPPPSSGAEALSVVETLDSIRGAVASSVVGVYSADSKYDPEMIVGLAREIESKLGKNGGIVSIDGQSGTGKSTLTKELADFYGLVYPGRRAVTLPYDELRLLWEQCSVFKKVVLGQYLTESEVETSRVYGWDQLLAHQSSTREVELWRHGQAEEELGVLSQFFRTPQSGADITIHREKAYIKQGASSVVEDKDYRFRRGDVVILEGKFVNLPQFRGNVDFSIRVEDEISAIRERFRLNRAMSLPGPELDAHMQYYDLASIPSWLAYEQQTRSSVDRVIRV